MCILCIKQNYYIADQNAEKAVLIWKIYTELTSMYLLKKVFKKCHYPIKYAAVNDGIFVFDYGCLCHGITTHGNA